MVTHADDPRENLWFASVRHWPSTTICRSISPNPNDPEFVGVMQAWTGFSLFLLLSPHAEKARPDLPSLGALNLHGSLLPATGAAVR